MLPPIEIHIIPSRRLEARASAELARTLSALFHGTPLYLVVDLRHVGFIDSLGISALATTLRRAPAGSRVVLASLQPSIRAIARMTRLHEVFDIFVDADAAVAALSTPTEPTQLAHG
jgi:anti-sigma B factor antagonist